jgi:hypothetical protein
MPFKKGNTIWKDSHKSRAENKTRLSEFLDVIADGGIVEYANRLDDLANSIELTKEEREFMDRFEGWREYVAPKLARTENKTEHSGDININWGE